MAIYRRWLMSFSCVIAQYINIASNPKTELRDNWLFDYWLLVESVKKTREKMNSEKFSMTQYWIKFVRFVEILLRHRNLLPLRCFVGKCAQVETRSWHRSHRISIINFNLKTFRDWHRQLFGAGQIHLVCIYMTSSATIVISRYSNDIHSTLNFVDQTIFTCFPVSLFSCFSCVLIRFISNDSRTFHNGNVSVESKLFEQIVGNAVIGQYIQRVFRQWSRNRCWCRRRIGWQVMHLHLMK